MNWKASPPAIEVAAASIAAACLGGAVGFAVARIAPLGAGLGAASVAGAIVAFAAWSMIGRIDSRRGSRGQLAGIVAGEDVLLLDQLIERDECDGVLLLDDPLPAVGDESRVVRLFAAHPVGAAKAASSVGPGEMVARIEDFLGLARGSAAAAEPARRVENAASEDASAALHAALADIRRSLRQG